MRLASVFSIITAVALLAGAARVQAQDAPLIANLSLGSTGAPVVTLQKILNGDPDTRVADVGPGSPGNETGYFGALTQTAVIRFQEKYANEVLTPVGLSQGSGYVGLYTRMKLNGMSASSTSETSAITALSGTTEASTTNPNMQNIDFLFKIIDQVETKQGLSTASIAAIKQEILKRLATTTDLKAKFLSDVASLSVTAPETASPRFSFNSVLSFLKDIFSPRKAYAALPFDFSSFTEPVSNFVSSPVNMADETVGNALSGILNCVNDSVTSLGVIAAPFQILTTCVPPALWSLVFSPAGAFLLPGLMANLATGATSATGIASRPFGGKLFSVIPCDVGMNIVIVPPAPQYPTLLYYLQGTQKYSWYNIPLTGELLGKYTPAVWACWITFIPFPAEGTITPVVGSSPTPIPL